MKTALFVVSVFVLCSSSCCRPKENIEPQEVYNMAFVTRVTRYPSQTSCANIMVLDTDNDSRTVEVAVHAVNLPRSANFLDTFYIQYKMLPDTLQCELYYPVVGNPNRTFPMIEILKIKD